MPWSRVTNFLIYPCATQNPTNLCWNSGKSSRYLFKLSLLPESHRSFGHAVVCLTPLNPQQMGAH